MKIGPERERLSERLRAETKEAENRQAETDQLAASISSAGASLKADLARSFRGALTTIEADLDAMALDHRRRMTASLRAMQADLDGLRRITQIGPWMALMAAAFTIEAGVSVTYTWAKAVRQNAQMTAQASALQRLGITPYRTAAGPILLIDAAKLKLGKCRLQGEPQTCLTPVPARP